MYIFFLNILELYLLQKKSISFFLGLCLIKNSLEIKNTAAFATLVFVEEKFFFSKILITFFIIGFNYTAFFGHGCCKCKHCN